MTSYKSLSYFLIFLFLLFSVTSSANSHRSKNKDPCAPVIATKNPKYKDIKNCLTSFPYNAVAAKEISIRNAYKKLRDAHTQFSPSCYNFFLFEQNLHLYSVLDKQGNQVFDDLVDPTNIDCEVTFIDSVPAFDAIKNFANNHSFISRDLGVRFNNVLTSISLANDAPWILGSEFTVRGNGGPLPIKDLQDPKRSQIVPYVFHPKARELLSKKSKPSKPVKLSKAIKVDGDNHTQFYKSTDSDFGVVVLIDENITDKKGEVDFSKTLAGFKKLANEPSIKK
ncbi:2487_t:CDS:2, partial [Racocetra fulgida]